MTLSEKLSSKISSKDEKSKVDFLTIDPECKVLSSDKSKCFGTGPLQKSSASRKVTLLQNKFRTIS